MRHRGITAALVAVTATAALAACSSLPDDPGPSPADFAEEPIPSVSPSPTPSQSGVPVTGCPTNAQVLTTLAGAGAVDPAASGLALSRPPTCAGGWTAATVAGPDADPLPVVLRTRNGRLYVVTAGSGLCADPDVAPAPAPVRAAVGC
ncbi:MAG: hypothetical protein QOC93_461 [Actinomycetota bacterium]|jgi:hypothetical protein|nr:hypothetical protein [Cryptosporangiaceae bacterium]MDQ1675317.1 hypothetical protein [Actinomycetota bacterium]